MARTFTVDSSLNSSEAEFKPNRHQPALTVTTPANSSLLKMNIKTEISPFLRVSPLGIAESWASEQRPACSPILLLYLTHPRQECRSHFVWAREPSEVHVRVLCLSGLVHRSFALFFWWENSFAMGLKWSDMKEVFVTRNDWRHTFPTPSSGVNLPGGASGGRAPADAKSFCLRSLG